MSPPSQWALITGVSPGGLGDALAIELMSRFINIVATGLHLQDLSYLQPINDTQLVTLQLDVTDPASISTAVTETSKMTNGRLDYLFNNAGYGYMMPLLDCDIDQMKRNFDVNVFGVIAVTQAFLPLLREARGTVVNQSSIAGLSGTYQPFIGCYEASKSAVAKLSDVLRLEVAPFGVKVVTLVTGDVRTRFWETATGMSKGLPDDSPYHPIREKTEGMMSGKANPPGQHSRERWARDVVNDLLRHSPPKHIRRGFVAKTMWIIGWLAPYWILDWAYWYTADLPKLAQLVAQEDTKKTQ